MFARQRKGLIPRNRRGSPHGLGFRGLGFNGSKGRPQSFSQSRVSCSLYTIYCTLCTVYCTLFTAYCTLYTVYGTFYTVYCTPYTAYCTLYTVSCTLYTVYCTRFTENRGAAQSGVDDGHETIPEKPHPRRQTLDPQP